MAQNTVKLVLVLIIASETHGIQKRGDIIMAHIIRTDIAQVVHSAIYIPRKDTVILTVDIHA
jgi:hypothetical protein